MSTATTGTDISIDEIYHAGWGYPKFEASLSLEQRKELKEQVKELSRLRPLVYIANLFMDWVQIVATIYFSVNYLPVVFYPFSIIIIASRQHALLVLMHDAVHYSFLKSHRLADLISNLFAAFPMLITTENFRYSHLMHHRFINSENDPDLTVKKQRPQGWIFPKTSRQINRLLIKEILGGGFIEILRKLKRFSIKNSYTKAGKPNSNIYTRLGYYAVLIAALVHFNLLSIYVIFWLIPILFVLPVFLKIRSIGDHFGLPGTDELNVSRNFIIPVWQKYIFAPHNIGVHVVHHLYPSIPYSNLLKMNRLLMKYPGYSSRVHQNYSIMSFKKGGLLNDLREVSPRLKME
jgi:fatty acid desaturase